MITPALFGAAVAVAVLLALLLREVRRERLSHPTLYGPDDRPLPRPKPSPLLFWIGVLAVYGIVMLLLFGS